MAADEPDDKHLGTAWGHLDDLLREYRQRRTEADAAFRAWSDAMACVRDTEAAMQAEAERLVALQHSEWLVRGGGGMTRVRKAAKKAVNDLLVEIKTREILTRMV